MSERSLYGQMKSEKLAEENLVCRQIVREISNFGITQRQQTLLIYLLAMELENVEAMQTITAAVREVAGDVFIVDKVEEEHGKKDA